MKQTVYPLWLALAAMVLLGACRPSGGATGALQPTAAAPTTMPPSTPPLVTTEGASATPVKVSGSSPEPSTTPAVAPAASPEPSTTPTAAPSASPEPSSSPALALTASSKAGGAANADVTYVRAVQAAGPSTGSAQGGTWTFHVTVQHPDTGWEDYADGWDVVTPDGTVLKPDPDSPFTRLLLHPHVDEQPFTRSQSGIVIPTGVAEVRVRAHDLVDGYGGREVVVDLTVPSGQGFEVERVR